MSELTYQQQAVYARLESANEEIKSLNMAMRSRASFIAAASTAIVALITTAKFLPASGVSNNVESFLLALVCLCSIVLYFFVSLIWRGAEVFHAGSSDHKVLYNEYLLKDLSVAYGNMLVDLCHVKQQNAAENRNKSRQLNWVIIVFMIQLLLLALAIAWSSIAAFLF